MRKADPEKQDFVGPYTYLINWEDVEVPQKWIKTVDWVCRDTNNRQSMRFEDAKALINVFLSNTTNDQIDNELFMLDLNQKKTLERNEVLSLMYKLCSQCC